MSKKHKNKIKNKRKYAERTKTSNNRKLESQEELEELGLSLESDTLSVGIVFDDLGISQSSFFCINQINHMCQKYVGINIQLFVQHSLQACIQPLCPIDDAINLISWKHPLIATSVSTCLDALNSSSSIVCHYASDIDFINQYSISTTDLLRAFCDPRVFVVARHQDHKQLIEEEFDIEISKIVVPDFEMTSLIKLITSEMYNAKSPTVKDV